MELLGYLIGCWGGRAPQPDADALASACPDYVEQGVCNYFTPKLLAEHLAEKGWKPLPDIDIGDEKTLINAAKAGYETADEAGEAHFKLGHHYYARGLYDLACGPYEHGLSHAGADQDVLLLLGDCYMRQEKYKEAGDAYERVVYNYGHIFEAHIGLGQIDFHTGYPGIAELYFRKALDIGISEEHPDRYMAYQCLGHCHVVYGNAVSNKWDADTYDDNYERYYVVAKGYYANALNEVPDNLAAERAAIHISLASVYSNLKMKDKAEEHAAQARILAQEQVEDLNLVRAANAFIIALNSSDTDNTLADYHFD